MSATVIELTDPDNLREKYESLGAIPECFSLAHSNVVEDVAADVARYAHEVARNKAEKLFRVPYILTQSIVNAAHDPHLVHVVSSALGTDELVMWGPNIQHGTPNESALWHTDIESWFWPCITVAVGLTGCNQDNSTLYVPGSQRFLVQPWAVADTWNQNDVLAAAAHIDGSCDRVQKFAGFGPGRFYAFNAKTWHCGCPQLSGDREVLFLHYQPASNPRIPYINNYQERTWFDFPAVYWKLNTGKPFTENRLLCSTQDLDSVGPRLQFSRPHYRPLPSIRHVNKDSQRAAYMPSSL